MTDVPAATRRLLMLTASPALDHATIAALIRDTYTTPEAGRHLATATAQAIAAKLDHTPLEFRITTGETALAYLLTRHADEGRPDDGLLDGLTTEQLAHVGIALLSMWRIACARAAAVALAGIDGVDWPSEAPWGDEQSSGDHPDTPAAQTGA